MQTKEVPISAMRFAADVEMGTNGEGAKTAPVKIRARSGQPVSHWFWGKVVHDLGGMRSKPRIPIDYCHDKECVIGYANNFDTTTGDLVASGALVPYSQDTEDRATEVIYKSQLGIPYEGSIYFDDRDAVVEEVPRGFSVQVNGATVEGPVSVVRQWTLRGIAICPYGVDSNTQVEFQESGKTANVSILRKGTEMSATVEAATAAVEADENEVEASNEKQTVEGVTQPVEAESDTAEAEASAAPSAVDAQLSEGQKFLGAFGEKGGVWFAQGKTYAEAQALFQAEISAENDRLKTENAELKSKLSAGRGESSPVKFEADSSQKSDNESAIGEFVPKVGANLAKFAAGVRIVRAGQKKQ